jgi:hypothetical protein
MWELFNFEQDGRYPLRRIPMIMRFKLDACGIKLPLIAWALLSREQREQLVQLPCTSTDEKENYCAQLTQMLLPHADNPDAVVEFVSVESVPMWRNSLEVPPQIVNQLSQLELPAPSLAQWHSLSDLQRFALVKLTRNGHKNANLLAALREFDLAC